MKTKLLYSLLLIFYSFAAAANTKSNNLSNKFPPNTIRESMKYASWEMILQTSVDRDGYVNYAKIRHDEKIFNDALNKLSSSVIDNTWSESEKIAYWINVYNAFTIKLILDNYPVSSIKEIKKPWDTEFFSINGKKMSLGYVEHEILRKQFNEPRIHFAINCASMSCPRIIQIPYTSKNLNHLLERQTKEYINNSKLNAVSKGSYKLSKLFLWFSKDFKKSEGSVKRFINKYSDIKISNQSKSAGYLDYNWNLNETWY